MTLAGKVWGTTEVLLKTPLIEIHRLTIKPWSKCSMHTHFFKWNAFYVQSGTLFIEVRKNDYELIDVTEVKPGQLTTVKPTEYHRFVTKDEPVVGIEIYYPETLSEDIIREDHGSSGDETKNVVLLEQVKSDAAG
jgi:mannose-6-phosphate isomerase-like protein (cupin superfamily)